jgi:hypothetical protein
MRIISDSGPAEASLVILLPLILGLSWHEFCFILIRPLASRENGFLPHAAPSVDTVMEFI